MSEPLGLFQQAQLAEAAYANFSAVGGGIVADRDGVIAALQAEDFSETQATAFVGEWGVVDHIPDTSSSGFSATIFRNRQTGNCVLAIRGTALFSQDIVNDINIIAEDGVAVAQLIDLHNFWLRANTASDEEYTAAKLLVFDFPDGSHSYSIEPIPSGQLSDPLLRQGSRSPALQAGELTVTGHSLGGHLAMAFTRLFPGVPSSALAVNGLGFKIGDPTVDSVFAQLGGASAFNAAAIQNVYGIAGPEFAAMNNAILQQPGGFDGMFIEVGSVLRPVRAHSVDQMTDSAAVYDLFIRLSSQIRNATPAAALATLTPIFEASSAQAETSLEHLVDALVNLYGLDFPPIRGGKADREQLYQRIMPLRALIEGLASNPDVQVDVLVGVEPGSLAGLASGSEALAYRYALRELNPFAITGANSLYAIHNESGELNLFISPEATPAGMTQEYLADRAAFLARKNAAYIADVTTLLDPAFVVGERLRYSDLPAGLTVTVSDAVLPPNDDTAKRFIFGGSGPDAVVGGSLNDRLYGGTGTDVLVGGKGNDYLEGGAGMDVYSYGAETNLLFPNTNDGHDEIRDTDGKGVIRYAFTGSGGTGTSSQAIGGLAFQVSATQWRSPDFKFAYDQQGADLLITIDGDAGGSMLIRDFDFSRATGKGYLGIRLTDKLPPVLAIPVRTFFGDKQDWDSNPSTPNEIDRVDDGLGNYIRADGQNGRPDIPFANRVDLFLGSSADEVERFETAGGDDFVRADGIDSVSSAAGGRDIVLAGAGSDIVEAGGNDDWVEGGAGDDILGGNSGNDVIWADSSTINDVRITLAQAITAGRTAAAIAGRGDLLSGDAGFDRLIGSSASDLLLGGADVDIIVGGGGDDNIYGDASLVSASRGWVATRRVSALGSTILYELLANGYVLSDTDPGSPGSADYIYGGAGADWIFAGAGDDYVEAGDTLGDPNAPDDVVFGEAGDDIIIGGSGSDVLHGDSAAVDAAGLSGNDYLDGGAGIDLLFGGGGDDILFGGDGGDRLHGNDGNDILIGERGNDLLVGGPGKDTYIFFRGDGVDTIQDVEVGNAADASVLVVGPGIFRSNVRFRPGSLTVDFGEGDEVHFEGFDPDNPSAVRILDVIRFWDGDFMTYEDVLAQGFDIDGTSEDDEIFGTAVTDRIFAGAGNDFVMAKGGDDTIDGGTGDDDIYAGEGNDTVTAGDGNDFVDGGGGDDTIDGGPGDDILMGGEGDDTISGGEGQDLLFGGAGNDVLSGDGGDDVLDGGTGNDVLVGGAGSDSYVMYGGMGSDIITDGEGGETNALQLGAGLTLANLKTSRDGDSLVLTLRGLSDSVTITDYYARPQDWVVRSLDGTETALTAVINQPDPYAGDFLGRLWADTKLGASAAVFGRAYAIGWTPLSASTFQSTQERAFLEYRKQTTVETFSRFEAPHDQLAQNTFVDLHHEVEGFGTRPSTNFHWIQHSFVSGYTQSDDTFIQGSWIELPQLQSPGGALLTLKPDRSLTLNYQLTEWGSFGSVVSYDTGTETILAIVDYDYELESYQQFADVVNVGPVPNGWFHDTNQIVGNRTLVNLTRFENRYLSVNEIYGGPSANTIIAGHSDLVFPLVTLIDGGGGNDWLSGDGGLLYGNAGDDVLSGANAILIGGDGNDTLTGLGGTRFIFTASEIGIDKVREAAIVTESYFNWYYAGFGIADWLESAEHGGKYRATFGEGEFYYYDTFAEAQSIGGSEITFINLLPGSAPVIKRTDAAALQALEAAGVLTRDVVEFGPGIGLSDLELNVRVIGLTADEHPGEPWYGGGTLAVRWGAGAGFDLVVPETTYGAVGNDLFAMLVSPDGNYFYPAWQQYDLGVGVELFEFADGSVYTLDELLQQATVIKRYGYEFLRGSGWQLVEGNWTGVDFGADIAPSDLYAFQSGPDLVFGVIADSAIGNIPNWYANPATVPPWEFRFADETVLDTDSVTRLGQTRIGSPFNDTLQTYSAFASALIGLGGDDLLIGGAGNDLLNGGPGHDFLHGEGGNDIYVFGADSDVDYVNEQVFGGGSNGVDTVRINSDVSTADLSAERDFDFLTLRVISTGAELQLPGWFTEPGGTVEIFQFADGTTWHAADVEALLPPQVATSGDDVLLGLTGDDVLDGLEGDDVIYGFGGNDTLRGGLGNDVLLGGAGDDTYLFAPGDGIDEISDQSGSNTLRFGDGIAPQSVNVTRDYDALYLAIAGSGDRVGIRSWFFAAQPQLTQVSFADGTTWTAADLESRIGLAPASDFDDILWGTDGADVIYGLGGDDQIYGNDGDDVLDGGDGDDYIESGRGNDILRGGAGNDDLEGWPGDGHKLFIGGDGDDYIYYEGRSLAIGGPGDDWIDVYGFNGIVAFNPGDGADTIGVNSSFILSIGGGVGAADLSLSEDGSDIVISVGASDSVRLTNDFGGGQGSWPTIVLQLFGSAHLYFLGGVINEFYNARAADPSLTEFGLGDVLPRYLLVSSETGALGGIIAHQYATRGTIEHVTDAQFLAVLQDPRFGPFFQDTAFESGNSAPVLGSPIADVLTNEDAVFAYSISADAFTDPDAGEALTYSARLGSGSDLPAWLSFNAETRTFSGTPLQADVGTFDVKVTATDAGGLSAHDTFSLTVANVNDAPVVTIPLVDLSFEAGTAFSFSIPLGTFTDEDPGDTLLISGATFGGLPLPAWLSFTPETGTFSGNPTASNIGISHLQVTVTDAAGASVASDFGLVVRAAAGSEVVGTAGDDVLYGGTGDETITAKGGSDYLYGDIGDDLLKGGSGNDVLQGGEGADVLRGGKGQNVLDGGAGDDLIFGGKGSSLIVGGTGNDTIRTGSGSDVILFNRGDGIDTVISDRAGDNTLSFGGGIRYSDLSLSRDGKNLIVSAGGDDQIILKNWYGGKHSVLSLQVILDATDEFDAGSLDPLYNKRVQTFDFLGMVSAFDSASADSPGLTSWAMTNALLQFHLSGMDDMALGGDLAYWYGKKSTFSGISLSAAQQVIGAEGFGADAQTLRPFNGLQEGFVKLA